ncbi:CBU_0592 family membrane protein [Negadavirga shengliensis]|jgi:lipid-A-disaccharide synthase-like uncharacterized protein|uniref:CBU-0592-like domain-containing protein n=1 Tax=Negadavirga shengliensis TaxID=1389218 RepID=A0ABV9T446_9BACT
MLYEIIGWFGAFFFIVSYYLLSKGRLRQESTTYHLLNLMGAMSLIINALHFRDNANILVNGVWASIAIMALYQFGKSSSRKRS